MYKVSRYNCVYENENYLIVYNSLSKAFSVFKNRDVLNLENISSLDNRILRYLLDSKFIILEEVDEDKIAKLNRLDTIYDKTLGITVFPTMSCNLKCKYCYENTLPLSMSSDVQKSIVEYVRKNIREYSSLHIDWFGGEPLLQVNTINNMSKQMMDICSNNGKPYLATMTTNGFYLSSEVFSEMLKNKVFSFQITLDGMEDIHDQLKIQKNGDGTFNILLENLRSIRDKVKSRYFTIIIRTNVTKPLLRRFDEYLHFLNQEFGQDKRFTFLFRAAEDFGGTSVSAIKSDLLDEPYAIYDALLASSEQINLSYLYTLLTNSICGAAKRNNFSVYPDGKIIKCNMMLDVPSNIVGHMDDSGVFNANDKLAYWIVNSNESPIKCKNCSFSASCNDCPAKGIYLDNERPCGYEHSNIYKIMELLVRGYPEAKYPFIDYFV